LAIGKKRRAAGRFIVICFGSGRCLRDFSWGKKMWQLLQAFVRDEAGATAIEYAIIASGISIVIVAAVGGIGTRLNTTFGSVSTQLK
jgi:pilus assembly protein Flp/PilA